MPLYIEIEAATKTEHGADCCRCCRLTNPESLGGPLELKDYMCIPEMSGVLTGAEGPPCQVMPLLTVSVVVSDEGWC
jgi:hypothetical protein